MALYNYSGMDWRERFEYCSDRMNGGRARAILKLMRPWEAEEEAKA